MARQSAAKRVSKECSRCGIYENVWKTPKGKSVAVRSVQVFCCPECSRGDECVCIDRAISAGRYTPSIARLEPESPFFD